MVCAPCIRQRTQTDTFTRLIILDRIPQFRNQQTVIWNLPDNCRRVCIHDHLPQRVIWAKRFLRICRNILQELEDLIGRMVDRELLRETRRQRYLDIVAGSPMLPGVMDYISEAKQLGLKLGVASSSNRSWVEGNLTHHVDSARYLAGPMQSVRALLLKKFEAYCWFIDVNFENGGMGHLDLTVAVRMDWHEGFQIYGEHGSVLGKTFNPWYFKSSEVECFYEKDQTYVRVLGADAHFYRLQVEGFASTILEDAPQQGANFEDGMEFLPSPHGSSGKGMSGYNMAGRFTNCLWVGTYARVANIVAEKYEI